ncbi:transcription factor Myb2, partial [Volvox carteri f. nagariensis]
GGWTAEEDAHLARLVLEYGEGNWSPIARALNVLMKNPESTGRIGKQCRERWNHHLSPGLRKGPWGPEEEILLADAHRRLGNKWSDIARCIPGRSENAVKNHWNATLRKRL